MAFSGIQFRLGSCVFTEFDADGFMTAQPEGLGPEPRLAPYEVMHTYGFLSRPKPADLDPSGRVVQGKACGLLLGTDGDEDFAWLVTDPRLMAGLPSIKDGESLQYGAESNYVWCRDDGSVRVDGPGGLDVGASAEPVAIASKVETENTAWAADLNALKAAIAAGFTAVGVGAAANGPAGATAFQSASTAVPHSSQSVASSNLKAES